MDIDKIMKEIAEDLEINAMPFESWVYEVKATHQIIRKHLIKFNNVALADVRRALPSANEQQKEADEYGQMVSDTKERQIEVSTDFFNGATYIRICIDKGNEA